MNGIFVPVALKGLSEKVRALLDGEGVKLFNYHGQACDNDDNIKCVCVKEWGHWF